MYFKRHQKKKGEGKGVLYKKEGLFSAKKQTRSPAHKGPRTTYYGGRRTFAKKLQGPKNQVDRRPVPK